MTELAIGLGGCFGGCLVGALSLQSLHTLRANRKGATPDGAGRTISSPYSPNRFASPVTHLRNDPDFLSPRVPISSNASLSSRPADFGVLGPSFAKALDTELFVDVLRKLISEAEFLQNNPRLGIVPEERRAAKWVLKELEPFSTKRGGPLIIEELEYTPKRTNLKIVYPGTSDKTVAFVGSHLDVVPADREAWDKDPFSLTVEGDKLFGRGTTDCLGHVALLTCMLKEFGRARPTLQRSIIVLFIAGEEGGEKDVGVDCVVRDGKLDDAKRGPVYWVDSADSQPCCGTSGMMSWSLKCSGRLFHSGFPHKGINAIELAAEACSIIQERFYQDFPPHPSESAYRFATGSTLKPTQIECKKGSMNQICPECIVHGDIRLSPFYEVDEVITCFEQYVNDINESMGDLPSRGPWSKYVLDPSVAVNDNELRQGKIELKWNGDKDNFKLYAGCAVDLTSPGHKALVQAFRETFSDVKPFSVSGSLPLVNMMQKWGFDLQMCGFGLMSVYHGVNEYCSLNDMKKAYTVILRVVCLLETAT